MRNPEDNLIVVMTDKEVTKLYKTLLEIIEDLRRDHEIMMAKVAKKTDPSFSEDIDFFTPQKYEQIRKRVLDAGNECGRSITHFLGFYDSTVNVQRVQEAAQQKTVFKKTIISPPAIV
jgi:hypothetical protein